MMTYFHKTSNPVLSILICSLHKRKDFLKRIHDVLNKQVSDKVEIIVNVDGGESSIGKKRNELLDISNPNSLYVCAVDDDDLVSNDYVSRILSAVKTAPDCVGMEGHIMVDGGPPKLFIHSIRYKSWYERNGIYYRSCNHLNPVRREFAIKTRFPEVNMGEDHDYSMRLVPLLKKEEYIRGPIYFYEYRSNK